jgi:hypothetical protein
MLQKRMKQLLADKAAGGGGGGFTTTERRSAGTKFERLRQICSCLYFFSVIESIAHATGFNGEFGGQ